MRCLICEAKIARWYWMRSNDAPEITDHRKDYCLLCRIVFKTSRR